MMLSFVLMIVLLLVPNFVLMLMLVSGVFLLTSVFLLLLKVALDLIHWAFRSSCSFLPV